MTASFKSKSYASVVIYDPARGEQSLAYLYSDSAVHPDDHRARQGTAELDLMEEETTRLLGVFWANTATRGVISVRRATVDKSNSFEQASNKWPEQANWEELPPAYQDMAASVGQTARVVT